MFFGGTGTDAMVVVMCSGGRVLGANGISLKGGNTDLERSPPPGLCERENTAMKLQYFAVKYNFKYNIL